MNPVTSTNASGTANLIQLLSSSGSPLRAAGQSASQIQSELQNASPTDIVELSEQALQLQVADGVFGNADTAQTDGFFGASSLASSSATLDSILASVSGASASTTASGSGSSQPSAASGTTSSVPSQMALYQSELQSETAQALLGIGSTAGVSGTSLNVLG
ncbi:MAG: hypothetical protein ABSC05_12040 [Candidatus Solibacter sp.]|jgi:uncharacterized protein (DUF2336 family)